jgi:Peptidase family M1 domain
MRGGAEFPRGVTRAFAAVYLVAILSAASSCAVAVAAATPRPTQENSLLDDPRALYQSLNDLRPDPTRVYAVHELDLRRDVVRLKLTDGKLAFLQPIAGRITGAVFTGVGHVLATPRERGERRSLAQFLGVPILDQAFSRAYFRFTDDTAAELQEQLQLAGTSVTTDADFAATWNSTVATLNPTQSLRVMFDVLSSQPLPYFYAAIASEAVGVFDVLLDNRRNEQVLFGRTRLVNGLPAYDVWASFPSADALKNGDATSAAPARSFAPLDYHIDTTIADDLSLSGKTLLHLKALRSGERIIPLELSRNLSVSRVQSSDGRPLIYFQNEELTRREILRHGNDSLLVVLPAPVAANQEIHFEVSYRGSVISDAGNGVEFVGDRDIWYAHLAGSDSFVPFDLSFRWPRRFTLVATGTQTDSRDDPDAKTGHWSSATPFEVAGFNLGEYKTETTGSDHLRVKLYANRELEDAILARLREHITVVPPPAYSRRPLTGTIEPAPPPAPLPSPTSVLKDLGGQILDSIQFFEKLNGPFPFDHLDVSQIPGTFGQGWPELVYLSTLAFLPPEAQARAGFGEETQEESRELMAPHEVAHQWWGNVVGEASYRDAWIQEGMATYLSLLEAEAKRPTAHRLQTWLERYRKLLTTVPQGSTDAPDDAGPLTLGVRLNSSKIPQAYNAVIYGKGAWVMHMLREMLRDPGTKDPDARFRDLLHTILADYRFRPLTTADFQHEVEKKMTPSMDLEGTRKMDWFFEEWVHATGIPHYKVEYSAKPRGADFVVSGKLLQSGVDDVFSAAVPLYAAHIGAKPTPLGVVVSTGPETRFHFVSRVRPTRILIDPQLTLLCRKD